MGARAATVVLAGALVGFAIGCRAEPTAAPAGERPPAVAPIEPGEPIEGTLAGGQQHELAIHGVRPGQLIDVIVEQSGVDVAVDLYAPSDERVAQIDSVRATIGAESGAVVAAESGAYRLVIRASLDVAEPGSYRARVAPLGVPTPRDQRRVDAVALVERARGHVHEAGDALPRAMDEWRQAAEQWEALGDRRRQAEALSELGRAHDLAGNNERARSWRRRALAIQREIGDRFGEGVTLYGLARVNTSLGEIERALDQYERAADVLTDVGAPVDAGKAIHNAAAILNDLGEHQRAMELLERSLATFERLGLEPNIAVELNELGALYYRIGNVPSALENFRRARAMFAEHQRLWDEARVVASLGQLHAGALGDLPRGRELLEQALAMTRRAGDRRGEATVLNDLGRVHMLRGEPARALALHRRALVIQVEMKELLQQGVSAREIAECHLALGDAARARRLLGAALALTRSAGARGDEARVLDAIARAERRLGHAREALAAAEAAIAVVEDIRTRLSTGAQRTAYFASVRDHYDLHIDLLMSGPRPRLAEAFAASERSRARTLLDTLAAARAEIRTGVAPELLQQAQARARAVRIAEHRNLRLMRGGADAARVREAEAEVARAVERYQETLAAIRATSVDYAALTQPQRLAAPDIQRRLPDDVALLEYSLGPERSYLWVVTREHIAGHTLAPRETIEAVARRAYAALTARNRQPPGEAPDERARRIERADGELDAATAELAALVFEPAADALAERRLLIVPDGALHYVPYGVLPVPGAPDERLVDRFEIGELPAASVLPALARRDAGARDRSVAILADPVFSADDPRVTADRDHPAAASGDYPRLRFSRAEADAVAALAPDRNPLVALDFSASERTALSPQLRDVALVHFATHGVLNSRYPELSSLVLSLVDPRGEPVDGFLRLHEIYNMNLHAELVVLSGCETALGKHVRGEGLVGLTRGFLYAGARRVVASLWRVDDRATAELMKRFYAGLLGDGLAPPAALRAAQQSMKADPQWAAPYYWAGFVVQGDL